jgi:hypothetical protein
MIDQRTCSRLLRLRAKHWPSGWPLPTGAQYVMIRALLKARPNSYIAAVSEDGLYRAIVMRSAHDFRPRHVREYVILPDGRMRHVEAGEPYVIHHEKRSHHAA